jgi:lipopolysaccharide/colanic/teichoic acid biosynthesis glycosyltransferase
MTDVEVEPRGLYATVLKRVVDVAAAMVLIVVLLPLMVVVGFLVRVILGAPILHHDVRAGRHGRPIGLVKFRSMRDATDDLGRPLPDADRLGLFGRLLRQTSLDELPQLFSVLVGDMSLVGPRPLPERYVSRYSPRQATRLLVRPGMTGWAQIHGRNRLDWPEKLEYDARYVEILRGPAGPLADLWIIGVTVLQMVFQTLTGRGIAAPGSVTAREFQP